MGRGWVGRGELEREGTPKKSTAERGPVLNAAENRHLPRLFFGLAEIWPVERDLDWWRFASADRFSAKCSRGEVLR